MGKCRDCYYWKRCIDRNYRGSLQLGECSCDKFWVGYHLDSKEVPKDGVLVENDEGWGFYTGEEFGCIHFICKNL